MYASLESFGSSTDSGCDQCAELDTAFSSPVQNVNNAVSQYAQGAQMMNNQQQQYHNNVMNSNSVGLNQNNSMNINSALNNLQPPVNTAPQNSMMNNRQQSNGQAAMQQMVSKAVTKPNINNVRGPTAGQNNQGTQQQPAQEVVVEAFEQAPVQVNIPSRLILANFATVILVALALNEAFKYYINRGLQMADGSPHYYAFYALGSLVLAAVMYYVSTRLVGQQ
jgi:hypothetical protein